MGTANRKEESQIKTLLKFILVLGAFLALALIITGHAMLVQRISVYGADPMVLASFFGEQVPWW